MRKRSLWAAALIILLTLTGCEKEAQQPAKYRYDFSAIYLDVNDTVSEIIVEDFDKEYYNADELKQFLQDRVSAYNEENQKTDAVVLDRFEHFDREKRVKAVIDYATVSDYRNMTKRTLYIGTMGEAQTAGYVFGAFRDLQSEDEIYVSAGEIDANMKVVVYEKDETEDGKSGQELVTDQYTLLYDCTDVTSGSVDRPLRAAIVE